MIIRVASELRIENKKGRIEIGTKAEFIGFHMNEFLMCYQKSLSCRKDKSQGHDIFLVLLSLDVLTAV